MNRFGPTDLFERAFDQLAEQVEFGRPVTEYRSFGHVVDPGVAGLYDFICISACRNCGGLNQTLAQEEQGIMMPMSAAAGPNCKEVRCGDKVSAGCYGYFRLRKW